MALISWRRVRRNQVVDTDLIQLLFNNDKALADFVVSFTATTSDHTAILDTLQGQIATLETSVASAVADAGAAVADASAALAASSAATSTANAASNAATQAVTTAEQANATAIAANNAAVAAQASANNAASDAAAALAQSITAQNTANAAATNAAQAASDAAAATATASSAAADAAQASAAVSALQTTVGTLQSSVNNHETRIVNLEAGGGGGGGSPTPLTDTPPPDVKVQAASAGVSVEAARGDHVHNIATAAPVSIGSANAAGSSTSLSRADHVHAHGNQAGGTLHAEAVAGGAAGFMSGADKQKLAGIAAGADVSQASNANTAGEGVWLDKSAGVLRFKGIKAGSAKIVVAASAGDNTISVDLGTVSPSDVGAAPSSHVGSNGAAHAVATTTLAGFMSAADKEKLDGIATGATNTPLSNFAPPNVEIGSSAGGSSAFASRSDHKHSILAGIPVDVGNVNAEGTSSAVARADHVHRMPIASASVRGAVVIGNGIRVESNGRIHVEIPTRIWGFYRRGVGGYDLHRAYDTDGYLPPFALSNATGFAHFAWGGVVGANPFDIEEYAVTILSSYGMASGMPVFPCEKVRTTEELEVVFTGSDWQPDDVEWFSITIEFIPS